MKYIENFKSIIEKYQIIFFDAFGVIKTYQGPGTRYRKDFRISRGTKQGILYRYQ